MHECWRKAMDEEIHALEANKKVAMHKWIYTIEIKLDDSINRSKAKCFA